MTVVQVHQAVAEATVGAPMQTVWELVTDISLMPRFSTELQAIEWAQGCDTACLGARFIGVNRHPGVGQWTTTSTVIEFDPPRTFAWAVGDLDNPAATWRFDLNALPVGTALRHTANIGPGPSGVTMLIKREPERAAEIISNRLAEVTAAMTATLAAIAGLAERGGR